MRLVISLLLCGYLLVGQSVIFPGPGTVHSVGGGGGGALVGTPLTNAGAEPITLSYTVIGTNNSLNVCLSNAAGDTVAVDDSKGNTYTSISTLQSGNGWNIQCFRAITNGTGADTINCHGQFGDTVRCYVAEFSGTKTSADIDTNNIGTGASGTTLTSAAFTTTGTDIIIGFGCNSFGTPAQGAGFSLAVLDARCVLEYKLDIAAGSQTVTATTGGSTTWLIQGYGLIEP